MCIHVHNIVIMKKTFSVYMQVYKVSSLLVRLIPPSLLEHGVEVFTSAKV